MTLVECYVALIVVRRVCINRDPQLVWVSRAHTMLSVEVRAGIRLVQDTKSSETYILSARKLALYGRETQNSFAQFRAKREAHRSLVFALS